MDDPIAVLERLLESSKWPTYPSRQHSKLWELARDAYDRQTFDGYLSYVLITSQYCEDFARTCKRRRSPSSMRSCGVSRRRFFGVGL